MTFFGGSNPIGQPTGYVTSVNGDTGAVTVVTQADIDATVAARSQLGAMGPAVQQLIDSAITTNNTTVNQLSNKTGILPATQTGPVTLGVGGASFANTQLAINALFALLQPGGATAPVPNAAPTMTFPGGTGDVGETVTIGAGTYTVATPTSVSWNVTVNGSVVQTVTSPSFVIPASAGLGSRALSVTELYTWAGATNAVGKTSITATVNAPAAVPVIVTAASLSGTAQVGQVLTGSVGSWTNTPTAYIKTFYRNGVAISGATATDSATTLAYTTVSADAGASITFGVIATNAASGAGGTGVTQSVSTALVIAGGIAPSWTATGAVLPGWVDGTFQVGVLLVADFGAAANNPAVNGYSYQVLRDGVAILGASGSGVSSMSYTPVSADQDHELSYTLTASNAAGSATTTTASVTINAATAGGGGTASFVGSTVGGRASGDPGATFTIAPYSGIQNADFGLLVITINDNSKTVSSITGSWTLAGGPITTAAPDGQTTYVYKRVLTGSEPASYTITLSAAQYAEATFLAYRGPTSVIDIQSATNASTNASPVTVTAPTATTNAVNQTAVILVSMDVTASGASNWTQPSGFTQRQNVDFTVPPYGYLMAADKIIPAIGATGTFAAVDTTTATGNGWHAWTVILG